ncbi:hydrogenase small subunit [Geobacter sp. SVR]|uniref:hydrogenase small subunit n=1 Tax=Geobacter sp. SVR TaxID=2495594 RepID=UPI00143EF5CC|nr:hydrogenase small subunit [Geobacter sp. SVR]BCS52233.1 Ni/Fe hydrogenase [Geobacter sp. SVR]GCF85106.1 Ni/Fe hydrogenase [Geobacter sp. SVR]
MPIPVRKRDDDTSTTIAEALSEHGVTRRQFLQFCTAMSATLALPGLFVPRIASALEQAKRPTLVWMEFQECCGNIEAFLRAANPTVSDIILDIISLDYNETIMAASGQQAHEALAKVVKEQKGSYIAAVEGSIPLKQGGIHCCIGGRTALELAREVCGNALTTIAVGSCAAFGGVPAASPNPTGAVGVKDAVSGIKLINLPGCPANTDNITATLVHYLVFNKLPETDRFGRPLFAYGKRIHDNCERRSHFDSGQYVEQWGDMAHRQGHCLYKMGCKGPETFHNCPSQRYNQRVSWPVAAGHGCVGCSEPQFWDTMAPYYHRLPHVPGFGIEHTADKIGAGLAIGTAAAFAAHGVISALRKDDKSEGTRGEKHGEDRDRPDNADRRPPED